MANIYKNILQNWKHVNEAADDEDPNATEEQNPDEMVDEDPNAMEGQDPNAMAGQDPNAMAGQDPNAMAGQDPNAMAGQDPNAMAGQDPNAMAGQDPNAMAGQDPNAMGGQGMPPSNELPVTSDNLSRMYALKNIHNKLMYLEDYVSTKFNTKFQNIKFIINDALNIFEIVATNLLAYQEKLDKIISTFYTLVIQLFKEVTEIHQKIKKHK